jgi:chromosomal replication initiator protein
METSYYALPGLKYRELTPTTTKEIIIREVCQKYNVSFETLKSKTREREIVFARQLAMYLIKKRTGLTFKKVGQLFNRDHTTAIHAVTSIENYIETDSFSKRAEIMELLTQ